MTADTDFAPAIVAAGPTVARQCAWSGRGPVLLENRDLLTTVYLSGDEGMDPGGNDTVPLDPLGSKGLDGTRDVWCKTISGTALVASIPGGTSSQVSPILIAEQLTAAGLATAANQVTGTAAVNNVKTTLGAPAQDATVTAVKTTLGAPAQDATVTAVKTTLGTPAQDATVAAVKTTLGTPAQDATVAAVKTTLGTPAQDATVAAVTTALGSPAQQAALLALPGTIAVTGAPNLSFKRQIAAPGAQAVAVGTPYTQTYTGINGTGYDLGLSAYSTAAAVLNINLAWLDSTSGQTLSTQNWWIFPGSPSTSPHAIHGAGPVEGDKLVLTVTAYTASVTINFWLFQNSRGYTRHDWRTTSWTATVSGTGNVPSNDLSELIVGEMSHGLATATSTQYLLPLYAGRVRLGGQTTSHTTDAQFEIFSLSDQNLGSSQLYRLTSDSGGNWNAELSLPRAQCQVVLVNNNAGTQTLSADLVAEEY